LRESFPKTSKMERSSGIDGMRLSQYNVVLPAGKEFIICNTLSGAVLVVDKDVNDILLTGEGPPKIMDTLLGQGFFVEDTLCEKQVIRTCVERDRWRAPQTTYRQSSLGRVGFVNLILTHECNLDCTYCYKKTDPCKGQMNEPVAETSLHFVQKEITEKRVDTLFLSLYGGEPLTNQDIMNFVLERLKEICSLYRVRLLVKLFTNGTLLDEPVLQSLSHVEIADVHLTFDAPEELHKKRRIFPDGKSSFNQVLRAAQTLEKHNINTILRINISEERSKEAVPFLEMLKENGIVNAHLYFGSAEPRMDLCTHFYSSYGYPGTVDLFTNISLEAAKAGYPVIQPGIGLYFSMCAGFTDYFHIIDTDGLVYKCMSLVGRPEHAVGFLERDGYLKKSSAYYTWMSRDPVSIEECSTCQMLPWCRGGCPAIAWRQKNTYNAPGCFTVDFDSQIHNSKAVKEYITSRR